MSLQCQFCIKNLVARRSTYKPFIKQAVDVVRCTPVIQVQVHDYVSPLHHPPTVQHTMSSSAGNLSRVKALQVLFAIAPDSLIQSVSGTSVSDVRSVCSWELKNYWQCYTVFFVDFVMLLQRVYAVCSFCGWAGETAHVYLDVSFPGLQ